MKQKTAKMASLQSPESSYDSLLFDAVIEATKKFYSELSHTWISAGSSTEYVK